jgi:signal peptide peptidase SppA
MIRADRFLNVPLALLPGETEKILRALELRAETAPQSLVIESENRAYPPYELTKGIAVIPINGILVHEEEWFSPFIGEMGYDRIRAVFDHALADPEAKAIALHVNSPGGILAGCFDLAERIFEARGEKPICAILDECAYSAAYALACAAEAVTVPRTGGTGSIGVVAMHVDITKALDELGIAVTTFQYGARKTDAYPTTPMTEEARVRFQAEIDTLGEMFVDLVARNRGIAASKVRATEAGCFLGAAGAAEDLADEVLSADEAFLSLVQEIA